MGKHLVYIDVSDETVEELLNDLDELLKKVDEFTIKWRRMRLIEARKGEAASGD